MNKDDRKILGGLGIVYLAITALAVTSTVALQSLAIAIFITALILKVYCMNRNCVVICKLAI